MLFISSQEKSTMCYAYAYKYTKTVPWNTAAYDNIISIKASKTFSYNDYNNSYCFTITLTSTSLTGWFHFQLFSDVSSKIMCWDGWSSNLWVFTHKINVHNRHILDRVTVSTLSGLLHIIQNTKFLAGLQASPKDMVVWRRVVEWLSYRTSPTEYWRFHIGHCPFKINCHEWFLHH